MPKFVSLQGIIEIYCISRKLVRDISRHYRVDCYKKENEIYVNLPEFHQVYTTKYNPVLFVVEDKKEELFHFHENPNPDCPVGANIHAVMDGRLRKFKRNLQKDLDDVTLQDLVKDLRKELKKGRRLWFTSTPAATGETGKSKKSNTAE